MPSPLILLAFDTRGAFEGSQFDEALALLPSQEDRDAVLRFKFAKDRHLALGSQLLRRYLFSYYYDMQWDTLRFGRLTAGGKPVLFNDDGYYDFNISHHGHWVILGATSQPGYSVGVDVVSIDLPHASSIQDFIRCFDPQLASEERQLLQTHPHPLEAFYTIWGLKESYTKAIGVGVYRELDALSFSNTKEGAIRMMHGGQQQTGWGFYIGWLDERSLAVICYGSKEGKNQQQGLLDNDQRWFPEAADQPKWIGEPFKGALATCFISVTLQDCKTMSGHFAKKSLE